MNFPSPGFATLPQLEGTYTLSPDRQMIYLAANEALSCAVTAMRPYLF